MLIIFDPADFLSICMHLQVTLHYFAISFKEGSARRSLPGTLRRNLEQAPFFLGVSGS